ncbi:MAG: COX15/CtaA family protein [Nannocystaceae bacterium]
MAGASRVHRTSFWLLGYTLFVVLFGAFVRITGSGAGCGQHWPTCKGEIVPRSPTLETIIEFTHRATSGLYGLLVLALLVMAIRGYRRGHLVRVGAWLTLVLTIFEALIGAGLVKLGLTAGDDSVARAAMMAVHLVSTSLLTGALTLTWWASGEARSLAVEGRGRTGLALVGILVGFVLVGMTGAVTALGDTLYPVAPGSDMLARITVEPGPAAHFLERLRIMHPVLALGVGGYVYVAARRVARADPRASVGRWASWVTIGVFVQLVAGVINIMLSAPGWMQLVHLLLGTLVWIACVLLTLAALEADA